MNKVKPTNAKGFTIIEVVLVLAIAGLIFLVVFLALPALQRSQRDTQRKNDLGRLMSQVTAYQSNTQGALPTAWDTTFKTGYLTNGGQTFADPTTGSAYTITAQTNFATVPDTAGELFVYVNAKCGSGNIVAGSGNRNFAAAVYQEQGGFYCQSN